MFLFVVVMQMGFGEQESRLGLRACEGNIQLAVAHIMKKKEVYGIWNLEYYIL